MQNRVYFNNETNTWSIVTKRVDMTTYNVIYEQQQGFRSEEEATKVYEESLEKYKKDIEKIRKIDTNFYTFQQYLEYWFHHVLPLYSSSKGYKVTAECAIYHFIIPQIETDIPLSKVTPEYINNLLRDFERTNNVSIAFSCKKFMMVALRSAIAEGLLKQFPFDAVRKVPAPKARYVKYTKEQLQTLFNAVKNNSSMFPEFLLFLFCGLRTGDDDDKIRLNQRKPSKYKGLSRFGPEKNLQRINKFMKERPIFYKNLIQMKENIRFYLRCFYCITKVMILQFNSENRTELARNG